MLLVLMYHQIVNPTYRHGMVEFKEHLNYLQGHFPIILPGESIIKNTLNICLTFDDAYFDFYYYVFPILQQKKIPAVLGVPTNFIQEKATVSTKDRLAISYPYGLTAANKQHIPLCTWHEIKEMTASGYITIASHSHNHVMLTERGINLSQELQVSKNILEQQLQINVNSLIFPYGRTSKSVNKLARQYYKYIMRIGSAANIDWQTRNGLIYRINADLLWQQKNYITKGSLNKLRLKYWLNYLRDK